MFPIAEITARGEYVPGRRVEMHRGSVAIVPDAFFSGLTVDKDSWYLWQGEVPSPHETSWESIAFETREEAERNAKEIRFCESLDQGENPLRQVGGLSHIAYLIHQESEHDGSLGECTQGCYEYAESTIREAATDLAILDALRADTNA